MLSSRQITIATKCCFLVEYSQRVPVNIVLHVLSHLIFMALVWGGQLCLSPSLLPQRMANQMLFSRPLLQRENCFGQGDTGKSAQGGLGRHFLLLEGRWAVWGIFFPSFPHLLALLPAWNLNYKMWEWGIWNHCCCFIRGGEVKEGSWGLQPYHRERGQSWLILEAKQGRARLALGWGETAGVAQEPLTFTGRFLSCMNRRCLYGLSPG